MFGLALATLCRYERQRDLPTEHYLVIKVLEVAGGMQARCSIMIIIDNIGFHSLTSIFWLLRDDNRPHWSVGYGVPIKPYVLCWAVVGRILGVRWAHIASMLGRVGHIDRPRWALVGPMLGLCWVHVGPILGHVEAKCGNLADFKSP